MKEETLKNIIKLADGFKLDLNRSICVFSINFNQYFCPLKRINTWSFYPLLLQKAIEGWNKKMIEEGVFYPIIKQFASYIKIEEGTGFPHIIKFIDVVPDKAKEKSLIIVTEGERK